MLTGVIKFFVVDANIYINFSRMKRFRLTLAVTKFQPVRKRNQG